MKVILLQDVAKIGRRFDVTEVPTGHALNMLIPKGLAEPATPENIKRIEARKNKAKATEVSTHEQFESALSLIDGKRIVVAAQANEKGHLFEALKSESIIGAIGGFGAVVSESQLVLDHPIKEVGDHVVVLQDGAVKKEVTITVEAA